MQGWENVLQETECTLSQQPIYSAVYPIGRIHRTVIRGGKAETALTSDPLKTFLHSIPTIVGSAPSAPFILKKEGCFLVGHSNGSLTVEAEIASWPCWDP